MAINKNLLTDTQIQQFIRDGYILVQAGSEDPIHGTIYDKLETVLADEGNVGNNILPRIPQIKKVFEHPAVAGALTSLLGPDYIMNPHRYCHLNAPGSPGQSWHKDCYNRDHNTRHPGFHWLLALYFPQEVTEDMGPTALLPGVQDWERISDADASRAVEPAVSLCGPAGTVALVDFDSWHRASANSSDRKRYMLKFQFARMTWPPVPSWNHESDDWNPVEDEGPVWRHVWNWLGGGANGSASHGNAEELLALLEEGEEAERLRAAYLLGTHGQSVVAPLMESLRREAVAVEPRIEDATPDNAHGSNPTGLRAAQALVAVGPRIAAQLAAVLDDEHWLFRAAICDILAQWGPDAAPAVQALSGRLEDDHWWVRRNATEALGRVGEAALEALPGLTHRLWDQDRRVRRVAALALAQLRRGTDEAVERLCEMFEDENRYNRFYARLALSRIDHPAARDLLLEDLFAARWCPLTDASSPY